MSLLELAGAVLAVVLALAALAALFARLVALPYLKEHLVDPVVARLGDLDAAYRLAALMYDSHIERSAAEWGHLWSAIEDLRKDRHSHDR